MVKRRLETKCPCGKPRAPHQGVCLDCHAAYIRDWRRSHPLEGEAKRRAICRAYTRVYIRRGKLIPRPCEKCGDPRVSPHHRDYSKPLKVQWLCRRCLLAAMGCVARVRGWSRRLAEHDSTGVTSWDRRSDCSRGSSGASSRTGPKKVVRSRKGNAVMETRV